MEPVQRKHEGRTEVAEDGLSRVSYGVWSSLWGPWATTEFLSRDITIPFVLWQAYGTSQVAKVVKNPPANSGDVRDLGSISGSGRSPGGGHGNHSSILGWRISWMEETGGLWSTGSQRDTSEAA